MIDLLQRVCWCRALMATTACVSVGAACAGAPSGDWIDGTGRSTVYAGAIPKSALPGLPVQAQALRPLEHLGVELLSVGLSASGFMVDVRYRVVDASKAQALAERKVSPTLINDATGDRYYVPNAPKIGPLRQSATAKQPLLAGRVYFMLFANPDRRLRQGERVSLHVGEAVVEDIVVR